MAGVLAQRWDFAKDIEGRSVATKNSANEINTGHKMKTWRAARRAFYRPDMHHTTSPLSGCCLFWSVGHKVSGWPLVHWSVPYGHK